MTPQGTSVSFTNRRSYLQERGLFSRKAIAPVSRQTPAKVSTLTSPGTGTCSTERVDEGEGGEEKNEDKEDQFEYEEDDDDDDDDDDKMGDRQEGGGNTK